MSEESIEAATGLVDVDDAGLETHPTCEAIIILYLTIY